MDKKYDNILSLFDEPIKRKLININFGDVEEIRLRSQGGIEVLRSDGFEIISYGVTPKEILFSVQRSLKNSLYANEEALREGRIIIPGGHRVSFSGRALKRGDNISSMDSFSGLCVRFCREIIGSAENIMPYILSDGQVHSTLILSPPGVGKSTVLRDSVRILSGGEDARKVVVVDEKGEICACSGGIVTMDMGKRCDVLSLYDKPTGINIAVRNLSPQIIATDEIGSAEDTSALNEAVCSGVKIIATAHADSMEDLKRRSVMEKIIRDNVFERYIFIARINNTIIPRKVYDGNFTGLRR